MSRPPRADKALGQHFLTDAGILERIVAAAGVAGGDPVLEIGPGPGGLTRALLARQARVWALEFDPRMVAHLRSLQLPGLEVLAGDALQFDYQALAGRLGEPYRLVGNLPYNISGPLLARLIRAREAFRNVTVMLQREVAERLAAPAGTKARGRLSVLAQAFFQVTPVLKVAPGAFRPVPRVESRVVRLDPLPAPPLAIADEERLWTLVRTGFGKRRKMLRNALGGIPELQHAFAAAGLSGRERPEELTVAQWIRLANQPVPDDAAAAAGA